MRGERIGEMGARRNTEPRERRFQDSRIGITRSQNDSDIAEAAAASAILEYAARYFLRFTLRGRGREANAPRFRARHAGIADSHFRSASERHYEFLFDRR